MAIPESFRAKYQLDASLNSYEKDKAETAISDLFAVSKRLAEDNEAKKRTIEQLNKEYSSVSLKADKLDSDLRRLNYEYDDLKRKSNFLEAENRSLKEKLENMKRYGGAGSVSMTAAIEKLTDSVNKLIESNVDMGDRIGDLELRFDTLVGEFYGSAQGNSEHPAEYIPKAIPPVSETVITEESGEEPEIEIELTEIPDEATADNSEAAYDVSENEVPAAQGFEAVIPEEQEAAAVEPAVAAEEPAIITEEPLTAAAEEPEIEIELTEISENEIPAAQGFEAVIPEEQEAAAVEPAVAAEEPAIITEEPLTAAEEPEVAAEEASVISEEPEDIAEEPVATNDEPQINNAAEDSGEGSAADDIVEPVYTELSLDELKTEAQSEAEAEPATESEAEAALEENPVQNDNSSAADLLSRLRRELEKKEDPIPDTVVTEEKTPAAQDDRKVSSIMNRLSAIRKKIEDNNN